MEGDGESVKGQKWTAEEEEALLAGVARHGVGKWMIILEDSELGSILSHRSNRNLKDKWRKSSLKYRPSMAAQPLQEEAQGVSKSKEAQRVAETKEAPRRVSKPPQDLESMLQLATEIYERCYRL